LDAADKEEAWKRDNEHGVLLEERYTNAEGNWVAVTFERTGEVKVIPKIGLQPGERFCVA